MSTSHSSTSSFEGLLDRPDTAARRERVQRARRSRADAIRARTVAIARPLPMGAVWAIIFMVAFHVLATAIYPRPAARMDVYRKTAALTDRFRPAVLVAGDSRAESGVMPKLIAPLLGLTDDGVINIAVGAGDTASAVAAYREFDHRMHKRPIMLLGVSISKVNDNAPNWKSDELLWSVGLVDRLRLVSVRRALTATFLPEKTLYHRLTGWPAPGKHTASQGIFPAYPAIEDRGFHSNPTLPPELLDHTCRSHHRIWYKDADIDGIRWRQFEANVRELLDAGVQVVVLNPPLHPSFEQVILADPVSAEATTRYERKLRDFCDRVGVPLLSYDNDVLAGAASGDYYDDPLHLNRKGAAVLSRRIGRDVAALIAAGRLDISEESASQGRT
jgi:lysophospholipase L1-like esterase